MRGGPTSLLAVLLWTGTACGQNPALRGRVAELSRLTDEAQARGAMLCAPRQLAIARAELYFATLELQQGFRSKAAAHLDVAELNAHAARNLSPAEGCEAPARPPTSLPDAASSQETPSAADSALIPEDSCPAAPTHPGRGPTAEAGCATSAVPAPELPPHESSIPEASPSEPLTPAPPASADAVPEGPVPEGPVPEGTVPEGTVLDGPVPEDRVIEGPGGPVTSEPAAPDTTPDTGPASPPQ